MPLNCRRHAQRALALFTCGTLGASGSPFNDPPTRAGKEDAEKSPLLEKPTGTGETSTPRHALNTALESAYNATRLDRAGSVLEAVREYNKTIDLLNSVLEMIEGKEVRNAEENDDAVKIRGIVSGCNK